MKAGAALIVGPQRERGEFVISARGLEGGGIYAVSRALRDGGRLTIDLMPDLTEAERKKVAARVLARRGPKIFCKRFWPTSSKSGPTYWSTHVLARMTGFGRCAMR